MIDVDAVSYYIDPLIHGYSVVSFIIYTDDIRRCLFSYNYDVFLNCSNPHNVKHVDMLPKYTTVSTVPSPLVLYHIIVYYYLLSSSIHNASVPSFFRILSFYLNTLCGCHLTLLFILSASNYHHGSVA